MANRTPRLTAARHFEQLAHDLHLMRQRLTRLSVISQRDAPHLLVDLVNLSDHLKRAEKAATELAEQHKPKGEKL